MLIFQSLLGCVLLYAFGFTVGYFSMKLLGYTENQSKFLGSIFSSPHTTSIPVILLSIIGPVLDKIIPIPKSFPINAQKRGYLYIILNSIFSNIWRWSGGYYLIQREDTLYKGSKKDYILATNNPKKNNEMNFKNFLNEVLNMPVIASIFSLLITMCPPLQRYFSTPGTLGNVFIFEASTLISKSYAFFIMLMLGLSLSDFITLHPSEETKKKIIFKGLDMVWISLIKLVIMPLVTGYLLIYIFHHLLKVDDVMLFLFLFMSAAPSAINMIVICTLKEAYVESISMLMVVMYGISIITMTLGVTWIISIISSFELIPGIEPNN